jgi:Glucose / Sorbosone dehydrogenase/Putative binding domain, N-terminal
MAADRVSSASPTAWSDMSTSRTCLRCFAAIVLALALGAVGLAPAAAAGIVLEPVLTGLASPVFVTHASDGSGRLFIIEQAGIIKVLQPGATTASNFLDIRSRVQFGGEQGLLGLAFHPGFETSRRFFVDYTRRPDGVTVIAEYHLSAADPNVADPAEIVLLTVAQPYVNHNGGMIEFGTDGDLYIGMGDGGSANDPGDRAQNVNELLGKILRIDVDHPASTTQLYSSPADNPFAGPTLGRDEIYADGFRNPWRFSFDRQSGDLVVGDVGQGAREEIDIVVKGGNYGWRTFEGTLCTGLDPPPCDPSGFVPPIAEYSHIGGRCSVTGGYVYRGSRGSLPAGAYLFGDYCSGEIFLLEGNQFSVIAGTGSNISSFGQDQDGELYVVEYGGTLARIAAASPCNVSITPPGLAFTAAGGSGSVSVTTAAGCDWTATTGDGWISITGGGSGSGDGTVRYDVAPNTGDRARSGRVTVAGQVHTVFQSAPRHCPVDLDPRRVLIGAGGGTGTITILTGEGCSWSATSLDPWFVVTSAATGTGSGLLQYRIDPNPTAQPRRARVRVGGRMVVIRQQ